MGLSPWEELRHDSFFWLKKIIAKIKHIRYVCIFLKKMHITLRVNIFASYIKHMLLTSKIHITDTNKDEVSLDTLYNLCYHAARLYNVGLYSVRQHYFAPRNILPIIPTSMNANAMRTTNCSFPTLRNKC